MEKVISVIISKVTTKKTSETTYTNLIAYLEQYYFMRFYVMDKKNFFL